MKYQPLKTTLLASKAITATLLVLSGATVLAQTPAASPAAAPALSTAGDATPWSDAEITKWDPRTLRVTLRHGEIKNLEMPPMTMVFRVSEASVLSDLKPGDKVRFRAEQVNGAYHVKQIEKAQ